ncbi:hypothetical protein PF008_g32033, partial [Phytophthora fragariae]
MEAESGGDPSDENETAAADTSASREDGARVKLAPTQTVTAKVGRAEDGMAVVVQRMSEDTKAKDKERAARYVATVRPAMAAARYVRADHRRGHDEADGGRPEDDAARSGEGDDVAQTGEGAESGEAVVKRGTSTEMTAMAVKCATAVTVTSQVVPTTVEVQQTAAVLKLLADTSESELPRATEPRSAATEASHEETKCEGSDGEPSGAPSADVVDEVAAGDEVQHVRVARRQARKRAKRERARVCLARKKRRERDEADEQQRESDARLEERQQVAVEAMEQLRERRRLREREKVDVRAGRGCNQARVSLVQHRDSSTTRRATRDNDVEYIGADDGLPTAIMEVAGTRRHVKLDSGAR